jgi:hypothetical protein
MRKTILIILVTTLLSCSGETEKNDKNFSSDKLVDSLKRVITTQNDSIIKLTQIINYQEDSILRLNGGVKADEYFENTPSKDSSEKR